MQKKLILLSSAVAFAAMPSAATACELDGIFGAHRFNPFANAPGFRGLAPPLEPTQSAKPRVPVKKAPPRTDRQNSTVKPKSQRQQANEIPVRELEMGTSNGLIKAEDMATIT